MEHDKERAFLLYGANGFTGKLILEKALESGLRPIIAGRSADSIQKLAKLHELRFRVFALEEKEALDAALAEVPLVIHAAGPFSQTAEPMMKACIRNKTHYLDITGEIQVFEAAHKLGKKASGAGIMIMPGTGFDVVPTDCMAVFLKQQLPEATHLKLAFASGSGGVSHGTALTMVEGLGEGGAERKDGKIISVPIGNHTMEVPLGGKKRFVMSIPWGDVSTAYHSTGIPNIQTFVSISPRTYRLVRMQRYLGWLLRMDGVKSLIRAWVDRKVSGPDTSAWSGKKSYIWGEASAGKTQKVSASMWVPGGYVLTAMTTILIAQKVLDGQAVPGFQTPAGAYGADLILKIPGTGRELLSKS